MICHLSEGASCLLRPLRRTVRLAILALLAMPVAGAAADAWDALGPSRIGEPEERIVAAVGLQCREEAALRVCAADGANFAGVPVTAIEARFRAGTLASVHVLLAEAQYAALLGALRARLGEPEDRSYRARAGMAGEFDAGVKLWTQDHAGAVVLEQFAGRITRSGLTFGDAASMASMLTEKRSYPPGALRDL
jgi:hypothetical protein